MPDNTSDKRSEFRLADEIAVFIETESSPDSSKTQAITVSKTLDISANGLQIMIDSILPLRSLLQLCLEISQQRFYVIGEVMWCKKDGQQFLVGFQLLNSDHTDIQAWKQYVCRQLDDGLK